MSIRLNKQQLAWVKQKLDVQLESAEMNIDELMAVDGGAGLLTKEPIYTTMAVGEEDCRWRVTSMAIGEEDKATTMAIGEEGGTVTSMAIGEELI